MSSITSAQSSSAQKINENQEINKNQENNKNMKKENQEKQDIAIEKQHKMKWLKEGNECYSACNEHVCKETILDQKKTQICVGPYAQGNCQHVFNENGYCTFNHNPLTDSNDLTQECNSNGSEPKIAHFPENQSYMVPGISFHKTFRLMSGEENLKIKYVVAKLFTALKKCYLEEPEKFKKIFGMYAFDGKLENVFLNPDIYTNPLSMLVFIIRLVMAHVGNAKKDQIIDLQKFFPTDYSRRNEKFSDFEEITLDDWVAMARVGNFDKFDNMAILVNRTIPGFKHRFIRLNLVTGLPQHFQLNQVGRNLLIYLLENEVWLKYFGDCKANAEYMLTCIKNNHTKIIPSIVSVSSPKKKKTTTKTESTLNDKTSKPTNWLDLAESETKKQTSEEVIPAKLDVLTSSTTINTLEKMIQDFRKWETDLKTTKGKYESKIKELEEVQKQREQESKALNDELKKLTKLEAEYRAQYGKLWDIVSKQEN